MARPAFAGRRARSRLGQLAAFGAVVMLVSAALAVLGGAIIPVLDAGAATLVQQSGASAAGMRVQARLKDDPAPQDEAVRAAFATALRDLPADIVRTLSVNTDATIDGQLVHVQLTADPGLPDAAKLTSGDWPSAPGEVAIQDAAASTLSLTVGDTFGLGDATVTVSGTWTATDPAATRWFGDPAVASGSEDGFAGPILADETVVSGLVNTPLVRWTLVPAPASLGIAGLGEYAEAMARLDTEVRRMSGGDTAVDLVGTLPDTVARATRVTSVAAGVLGLPLVLVAVAGAIVLALIARALASGRGGEFVLLRARGASLRSLTAAAAREAAVSALLAAVIGATVAVIALTFGLPLVGATGEASLPLAIGIAAGVAVLAVVLATIVTVTELRAPVTGRSESGRAAVIASLGPLALAAVAAVLALTQFLSLGAPVVVRPDGVVRTDPLALTAPVLVLVTAALAAPAIAGPIVSIAERFARAGRGILPVLPLRQLARRSRSVAAGVLVVALATGAIVLATAFHLGAADAREHAERAATGSDLRVVLPVRTSVEEGAPGASSALLANVDGVDASFAVLGTVSSIGADAIPLVAGDAAQLAAAPSAPASLRRFVDDLTSIRGGTPVPDGATQLTVRAQLSPGFGVPTGLTLDVLLWLADADGGALRVPLGTAPVADGPIEITGDIPATATTVLAVEFRPPALPPSTVIEVSLDGVQTPQGDAVTFDGEMGTDLTSSKNARFFPHLTSQDPLPVVLGTDLAERLGVAKGDVFAFRIGTVPSPIQASVVGITAGVPGQEDSLGLVLDLPTLEERAVELGGSVPAANQLWATSSDPDAAAAAVRAALTARANVVSPRTLSPGPVSDPTLALVELGVAVTAVLAILGFAAVAASIGRRRRVELTPLRSLGLSAARIRSARAIELVATAVLAVLLGAAAGLLTAVLVVPGLVGVVA